MAGNAAKDLIISERENPRVTKEKQERERQQDRQDRPWTFDKKGITYRGLGKNTDVRATVKHGGAWLELTSKF